MFLVFCNLQKINLPFKHCAEFYVDRTVFGNRNRQLQPDRVIQLSNEVSTILSLLLYAEVLSSIKQQVRRDLIKIETHIFSLRPIGCNLNKYSSRLWWINVFSLLTFSSLTLTL